MSASKWKPYPEYKPISHAGIVKIPDHWDSKRMRYVFRERGEVSEDGTEELLSVSKYTGVKVRSTTTDREARAASLVGYKRCEPNDIVSNIMLAWDSALGVSFDSGIVSSAYGVYVPQQEIDSHFLDLLLRTPEYRAAFTIVSKGIVPSRWRMYTESFNDIQMILPPLKEQKQIGKLVHKIDENISGNIKNLETQLSLLEENRSAIITKAVTKGLNPDVQMKDSGIDWIGEIPEHWVVKRMKQITNEVTAGPFGSSLTKAMYVKSGYRVYGQEQVIADDFSIGDYYISNQKFDEMQRYQLKEDDILVSAIGTIGRISVFPREAEEGIFNPRLVRYAVNKEMIKPYFLKHLLLSDCSQIYFNLSAGGTTMQVLNLQIIGETPLLIPPISEQNEITMYIEGKNKLIENYKGKITSKIEKLKEYRTALISAAVTGKIDVQ